MPMDGSTNTRFFEARMDVRPGWTQLAEGRISAFRNARGRTIEFYDCPQHWSAWNYDGTAG